MNVIVSFMLISILSGISTLNVIPNEHINRLHLPRFEQLDSSLQSLFHFFVTSAALTCFGVKNTAKANRADSNKNNFFFHKNPPSFLI